MDLLLIIPNKSLNMSFNFESTETEVVLNTFILDFNIIKNDKELKNMRLRRKDFLLITDIIQLALRWKLKKIELIDLKILWATNPRPDNLEEVWTEEVGFERRHFLMGVWKISMRRQKSINTKSQVHREE